MLLTMPPQPAAAITSATTATSNTPIFSFDFTQLPATPQQHRSSNYHHQQQLHRPAVSSPLSSSPIRASQSSPTHYHHHSGLSSPPAPLSPRDINSLPRGGGGGNGTSRRDTQSSPAQCSSSSSTFASIFTPLASCSNSNNTSNNRFSKYASRSAKPNPLRQSRETAQDSRRKLFLKNVRQRTDDRNWERRGGDQEALRLEWAVLDRRWREQKDADLDGFIFDEDIDDEEFMPQQQQKQQPPRVAPEVDEMMADAMALEEQRELDAMLSLLEPSEPPAATFATPAQQKQSNGFGSATQQRPNSPSAASDDEYDDLFMDFVSENQVAVGNGIHGAGGADNAWPSQMNRGPSQDFACSGEMDMS